MGGASTKVCDVVVSISTEAETLSQVYTYDESLGGMVTSVTPTRGGTAGGTDITITGTDLDRAQLVFPSIFY